MSECIFTSFQHSFKGVNAGNISFAIVDDVIPELDESYNCSLTKVNNNAELDNHTEISVTIEANDEPFGVFEVNSNSRELVAGESEAKSANNTIRVRLVILYTLYWDQSIAGMLLPYLQGYRNCKFYVMNFSYSSLFKFRYN